MNEAPVTTPDHSLRTPGSLQAILQRTDGTMETVAVALPLPEAIIRRDAEGERKERWFQRERSADSVLRYLEQEPPRSITTSRLCARCGQQRSEYYVPKAAQAPAGDDDGFSILCVDCYAKAAATP